MTLQTCAPENFCSCRWGEERTVKRAQTVSEDPHRLERKFVYQKFKHQNDNMSLMPFVLILERNLTRQIFPDFQYFVMRPWTNRQPESETKTFQEYILDILITKNPEVENQKFH